MISNSVSSPGDHAEIRVSANRRVKQVKRGDLGMGATRSSAFALLK
jgi:hypothetical protein